MTPLDAGPQTDDETLRALLVATLQQDVLHAALLMDPDGRIRWANGAAARIFGYPLSALIGLPLRALFVPEDVLARIPELELESSAASGHAEDDRWHLRADGSAFWANGATTAIRDASGVLLGFAKILRNRTEAREHVVRLGNECGALQSERQETSARLARGVHELRNPLLALAGAGAVLERLAGDNDALARIASVVQRQVEQMARLVDELMDDDSPSAASHDDVAYAPLQAVLDEVVAALASDPAERARLGLLLLPDDVDVRMDRTHLQQVLTNLLSNAFKYTPRDRPVWVRVVTRGDKAVVRFEDCGVGIAPGILAGIFELFTRATAVQHLPGSGIGLAVVRDLVTRYGGSVVAQSEGEGKGAVFTVRLPLAHKHVQSEAALVADARSSSRQD